MTFLPLSEITLSGSQKEAADGCIRALMEGRNVKLGGLAGTGKTTVARFIFEKLNQFVRVCALAPTGKAASVLRQKGVAANTIHSVIYNFRGVSVNNDGEEDLIFVDKKDGKFCDCLMVDETSMVTKSMMDDILEREIPTLWIGDYGQLPPVKSPDTGLLTNLDFQLTEIHRQASDNPIIKWAYHLRNGGELYKAFEGIDRVAVQGRGAAFVADSFLEREMDHVIVKTNAQRVLLNDAIRKRLGRESLLETGDVLICLKNDKFTGLVNGDILEVVQVITSEQDVTRVRCKSNGRAVTINVLNTQFGSEKRISLDDMPQNLILADYGYAITCHKMQGSSARHVGIVAKGYCGDKIRWNYTAATRAEEKVTVFI